MENSKHHNIYYSLGFGCITRKITVLTNFTLRQFVFSTFFLNEVYVTQFFEDQKFSIFIFLFLLILCQIENLYEVKLYEVLQLYFDVQLNLDFRKCSLRVYDVKHVLKMDFLLFTFHF